MSNRYVITVKNHKTGKIVVRKDFESYDLAIDELEKIEAEFDGRMVSIEFNTNFGKNR